MSSSKRVFRFTASGALDANIRLKELCTVIVTALSGDATVNIYDATGTTVDKRIFGVHHQPGTSLPYYLELPLHEAGYVEIVGTAEVYCYVE